MNLPNKLTIARMCAIPIIIIISLIKPLREIVVFATITLEDIILLIIFCIASFTDYLDGHIARKNNIVTNFGKFMDPLADKLLVLATLIVLLERGRLVAFDISLGFAVTLILAREFAITGIRLIAVTNNVVIAASKLGKLKTCSQMLMIIILLVRCYPFTWLGGVAKDITALVLIVLATTMTIVSGIDYVIKNKNVLKDNTDN
ncbi:MAG: CDP-diacylglycerol--glycerol-3-phosphate 3-phosphatidyltransferase [Bacilli bacterium]|nr:CDP-diacylglycerol--glycerol-3-phosphate 3-phosphatidyltransferase [Bacilli bacterium]